LQELQTNKYGKQIETKEFKLRFQEMPIQAPLWLNSAHFSIIKRLVQTNFNYSFLA